jgi:hypothetical protein
MDDEELIKKAMQKLSQKRWNGHKPMTLEEKREYHKLKQREYRAKKKK